jgi:hypothetical protein
MKRECKDCLHYGMSDDGDWYCRKHREHVQFINGCDDFWPKDSNPRCDECRFSRPSDDEPSVIFCYHTNGPAAAGLEHFCENWRARG